MNTCDEPVMIVNVPILSDDTVLAFYHFLNEIICAFESHYYSQLQRAARQNDLAQNVEDDIGSFEFEDEIPF